MSNTDTTVTTGKVEAAAAAHAADIAETRTMLVSGQKAALSSCVFAAVTLMKLCHPLPGQGEPIGFKDARNLLTDSIKKSGDVNDAFIERAIAIGRKLAVWLGDKGKDQRAAIYQANSLSDGVNAFLSYLATSHGIRDREAIAKWLNPERSNKVDLHPGSTLAATVAGKLGLADAQDFAKGLFVTLSDDVRAAVFRHMAELEAQRLKLVADGAAAAAAQELDGNPEAKFG